MTGTAQAHLLGLPSRTHRWEIEGPVKSGAGGAAFSSGNIVRAQASTRTGKASITASHRCLSSIIPDTEDRLYVRPRFPRRGPASEECSVPISRQGWTIQPRLGHKLPMVIGTACKKQTFEAGKRCTILEGLAGQTDVRPPNDGAGPVPATRLSTRNLLIRRHSASARGSEHGQKASFAELWNGKSSMQVAESEFGQKSEHISGVASQPARCITETHACFTWIWRATTP